MGFLPVSFKLCQLFFRNGRNRFAYFFNPRLGLGLVPLKLILSDVDKIMKSGTGGASSHNENVGNEIIG